MVSRKTKHLIIMLIVAVLASPFGALAYDVLTRDKDQKYRRKIHTRNS